MTSYCKGNHLADAPYADFFYRAGTGITLTLSAEPCEDNSLKGK